MIAPPSARQLASPSRSKFSIPFSPSMRVVQPEPGIHEGMDGIESHAASTNAVANTSTRFIGSSSPGTISVLLAAAAIDSGRHRQRLFVPGRRHIALDHFLERLEDLEVVVLAFRGPERNDRVQARKTGHCAFQ